MRIIEFGKYWEGTGMENVPIQWQVLDETDEHLFLISKQTVVSRIFDEKEKNWANSEIRKWLNNKFIKLAFNEYEQLSVLEKEIITYVGDSVFSYKRNPWLNESIKTKDRVFLLSVEEVDKYFPKPESRIADKSQYATDTLENSRKHTNAWWLRNWGYGDAGDFPVLILEDGAYYLDAHPENTEGIRPAIYVKKNFNDFAPIEGQLASF